jgi:signal transduction histidine kinase
MPGGSSQGVIPDSRIPGPAGGKAGPGLLARAWERVVAPSPRLRDPADQIRARLLAGLLAAIVGAGFLSGVVQLALVPGFLPTFVVMNAALAALGAGYVASRTRHYRVGGAIASLAPLVACLVVGASNPNDRVWYAFMTLGVLLASVFLSLRATALVAGLSIAGVLATVALVPELRAPERYLPPLMFQAVLYPLLLLATLHRDRLERERQRSLLATSAAVAEAQRLEALGRFASGIAHDFQNLLAVISSNVNELRRRVGAGADEVEDVDAAVERSAALVRQLLTFARRQPPEPRLVSPAEVVAGLEGILRQLAGAGVRLELERAPSAVKVLADRSQLEQVVMNLVVNARDAMPGGGAIRISVRDGEVVPGDAAAREGAPPGRHAVLEVSDTGTGMPEEVRRRIFEPFFSTKGPGRGNGIGLAIVHGIVKQSGGHVAVRTAPGEGSTFTVRLPRVDGVGPGAEAWRPERAPGVAGSAGPPRARASPRPERPTPLPWS